MRREGEAIQWNFTTLYNCLKKRGEARFWQAGDESIGSPFWERSGMSGASGTGDNQTHL